MAHNKIGSLIEQSEKMFRKVFLLYEERGDIEGMAACNFNMATVLCIRGDTKKAREYWKKALDLYMKIGMNPEIEKTQEWLNKLKEK